MPAFLLWATLTMVEKQVPEDLIRFRRQEQMRRLRAFPARVAVKCMQKIARSRWTQSAARRPSLAREDDSRTIGK